jgi:hypothetical protein
LTFGPLFFSTAAFWLSLPVIAILLIARLYRTRRRELVAGSLLLWRRLAAQQPKIPPRRVIVDASFILQLAVLFTLIAALSAPTWAVGGVRGREILLVLDNNPLARARDASGKPLIHVVVDAAEKIVAELQPQDRVFVACSSPVPRLLESQAMSPSDALKRIRSVTPALSGPDAGTVWLFCADAARRVESGGEVKRLVITLRNGPPEVDLGSRWLCMAPGELTLSNVGIIATGSALVPGEKSVGVELLVRLRNFSATGVEGTVSLEVSGTKEDSQQKPCKLDTNGEAAVVFDLSALPKSPVRVAWQRSDGKPDAIPEDDAIVVVPRPTRVPRVRFHGGAPAVERLYTQLSPPLAIVPENDSAPVDLEVFTRSVPDSIDPASHAMMLLWPEQGYHSHFDISGDLTKGVRAQRGDDDPLTVFIKSSPESSFVVGKAREIAVTGNLKVLMKDAQTDRPLIAAFKDERGRPAYVFAFVPGQGQALERPLEPTLAVILMRMADQAAGAGEPFSVTRAGTIELQRSEPLPLEWTAGADAAGGAGVLDATASSVTLGTALPPSTQNESGWSGVSRSETVELSPWLIVLALGLAGWELWRERAKTVTP